MTYSMARGFTPEEKKRMYDTKKLACLKKEV
jgi:hypothetical protein